MNVGCSAIPCPVILDSTCVFYTGANLIYTGINTNDCIEQALVKIDAKFRDAGLGYVFQNGITQVAPSQPVKLGGALIEPTLIANAGYPLTISNIINAGAHVTIGGTSSDFVKGDGSLDNTAYQPAGSYITDLTGDGTATGPGSSAFTLSTTGVIPNTYGSATTIPIITVDAKGRLTWVTSTALTVPPATMIFTGDVTGVGQTNSTIPLTLNTVLTTPGTFGSNITIPVVTVNNKGLVTGISQVALPSGGGTVTSIATSGPITGGPITTSGTIGITQASASTDGYLSSGNWTTFNNKVGVQSGSGTVSRVPRFTATTTVADGTIRDNGGSKVSLFQDINLTRSPTLVNLTILRSLTLLDAIGTMRLPYERFAVEWNGDHKFGVYTSRGVINAGAAYTLGNSAYLNTDGRYPGFEYQFITQATGPTTRSRFNYLERDATTGLVTGSVDDIINMFGNGAIEINPVSTLSFPLDPKLVIGAAASVPAAGIKLYVNGNSQVVGEFTINDLATGGADEMVTVDSVGKLKKQTIPSGGGGTVTSIATSGLISGGTITTSGTIGTSMNTNKLVGRSTAGVGEMEEITVGTGLSLSGGTLSSTVTSGILHGTATGTDTYTVTISGPTAYADGDAYLIRFTNGNTTSATLNINSIGAIPLYRNNDGALIGGDIEDGAEMLCVYNSTLVAFQCIGTSPNTILAYVTNDDSVTITKGQAVYAFGGQGDRMTVKLANNVADATSAQTVGLVWSASIGANQKGFIMLQGLLDGLSILPTATYTDGDAIYLGATAGSITNVKPYAPNHLVYLGVVTTASNGSAGRMYVKVQNGYELDELHNVQAQSPTVNDVLYYFGGSPGQWKTASISTVLGYTPVNPTRNIGTTAPLAGGGDLSADRTLSITQATASTDGYVSSTDWNTFNNKMSDDATVLGYQGLGSVIKGFPLGINLTAAGSSTAMTDSRLWLIPVYLPVSQTLTGVKWHQVTQGNYTADNYNGIGLYTISAGVATLVASSTNDGNIWKGTASTWQSKAFSSPYAATKGTYYIGALYNSSAQTTAPSAVSVAITTAAIQTFDFTSGRLYTYLATQTSLPASVTLSGTTSLGSAGLYFSLY